MAVAFKKVPLVYPQPPLSDSVVLLRPWEEHDLQFLEHASHDEYVAVIEHLPLPFSESGGRAWIESQHAYLTDGRGWAFAVVHVATRKPLGGVGILFRHPPGAAEPGVWIIGKNGMLHVVSPHEGLQGPFRMATSLPPRNR